MGKLLQVGIPEELVNNGEIEVVTRNMIGRYKPFTNIKVNQSNQEEREQIQKVINQVFGKNNIENNLTSPINANSPKDIQKLINELVNKQNVDPNALQLLAVKSSELFAKSAAIASWANVAISAAGLAATVISTVVICKKLDQLSEKIDQIADKIDAVHDNQFDVMLYQKSRESILYSKVLLGEAARNNQLDKHQLVDKINKASICLDCAIRKCADFGIDRVLSIINSLLPAYTNLIILYYEHFYETKYVVHQAHDDWMSIFDRLVSNDFLQIIGNDLILNKHVHNNELNDLITLHRVTVYGSKAKIEATLKDLEDCGNVEGYQQAYILATQYATETARELQSALTDKFGEEKTRDIMQPLMEVLSIENE